MSNETDNNIIVFLDNIGRTILGKKDAETPTTVSVINPAIVHVQPNPQNNQLQLQLLPLFFREFLAEKSEQTVWHFHKSNITESNSTEYAPQFLAQYAQLFGAPRPPQDSAPEVVRLFDEE